MKAVHRSETKVNSCQTVRCQISEESNLHTHCQGNLSLLPTFYVSFTVNPSIAYTMNIPHKLTPALLMW